MWSQYERSPRVVGCPVCVPARGIDALQDMTEEIYDVQTGALLDARELVAGYMDMVRNKR